MVCLYLLHRQLHCWLQLARKFPERSTPFFSFFLAKARQIRRRQIIRAHGQTAVAEDVVEPAVRDDGVRAPLVRGLVQPLREPVVEVVLLVAGAESARLGGRGGGGRRRR